MRRRQLVQMMQAKIENKPVVTEKQEKREEPKKQRGRPKRK